MREIAEGAAYNPIASTTVGDQHNADAFVRQWRRDRKAFKTLQVSVKYYKGDSDIGW
jgi:hypothetical protein